MTLIAPPLVTSMTVPSVLCVLLNVPGHSAEVTVFALTAEAVGEMLSVAVFVVELFVAAAAVFVEAGCCLARMRRPNSGTLLAACLAAGPMCLCPVVGRLTF